MHTFLVAVYARRAGLSSLRSPIQEVPEPASRILLPLHAITRGVPNPSMELFLVLVVGVVYAPLLLLLWVARKSNSSSGTMDGPARHAFNGAASSIKVASLNIRYAPGVQNPNAPAAPAQEHPWVLRK